MLTDAQKRALQRCYALLLSLPDKQEDVCNESAELYDETQTGEDSGRETSSSPVKNPPAQQAGARSIPNE